MRRWASSRWLAGWLAVAAYGCVYDATQITVWIDTDLRGTPLRIELTVQRGRDGTVPFAQPDYVRRSFPDAGADGGNVTLPASFAIVPSRTGPADEWVSLAVQISTEGLAPFTTLRRVVVARFRPHATETYRVFLSSRCLRPSATPCRAGPCTVQAWCEENARTCDERGECVDLRSCPASRATCGDDCVDTQSDTRHCGACATPCASGRICAAGVCVASCPAASTMCGSSCVDGRTNRDHCGGCDRRCPVWQDCVNGACACAMGMESCSGLCVDVTANTSHCGRCNNACPTGASCVGGSCVTSCSVGLTNCGACVDVRTDARHCGRCGNACLSSQVCAAGTCQSTCPTGTTSCSGVCANLQTDARNCGRCANACPTGRSCSAGTCAASCATGTTDCAGTCADLQRDARNCGACGNTCPMGRVCVSGACQLSCPTSTTNCSGTCANLQTDARNCGLCGNACVTGVACTAGACACVPSACAPVGAICCPGVSGCVNWTADRNHCGGCGMACTVGQNCIFDTPSRVAACTMCDPAACGALGAICCIGVSGCVNWTTDRNHCGACATRCASGQNCVYDMRTRVAACTMCDPPACGAFGAICCPGISGCVNWLTDTNHCGGCGIRCAAGRTCSTGSCV